jgi:acyl carrier protein
MLDKQLAMNLMQESLDSLARSGTLKNQIAMTDETVLMGSGADSGLDSLGFVNFVMDVEDRLQQQLDGDYPVILTDISGFDINNPILTAGVLADHLVGLAAG